MCCHSTSVCDRGASPVRGFCLASLLDNPQGTCQFGWVANTSIFQSLGPPFQWHIPKLTRGFHESQVSELPVQVSCKYSNFSKAWEPLFKFQTLSFFKSLGPPFHFEIITRADMGFKGIKLKSYNLKRFTIRFWSRNPQTHMHTRRSERSSRSSSTSLQQHICAHTHIRTDRLHERPLTCVFVWIMVHLYMYCTYMFVCRGVDVWYRYIYTHKHTHTVWHISTHVHTSIQTKLHEWPLI